MTRVPGNVIDGRSLPFPAGTFVGKLKEAKNEWYASDRKNKPDTKDALRLILTFNEITPIEGPNVGARPCMQRLDIVIRNKSGEILSLVDVTEFDDSIPYNLRQSATLFSQLALAWGAITRDADGGADVDFDQFIGSLQGGVFNNREVMFSVEQRQVDSKTRVGADGKPAKDTFSGITVFKGVEESAAVSEVTAPATVPGGLRTRA